ncbi:YlbE family protein [Tessaracoccus antarcticus]|uniref:DUF1116 domain-containing protein n=1 Tax=Tessaracoccus antarcticus TaxID=2479848 RepID=UPI0018F4C7DF|nr:DUF1116 domain-containing protein [Tessaracoccus antarcticus]
MSPITDLFSRPLSVISVGAAMFAEDIATQGAPVTHLEWSPPGGGRPDIVAALTTLSQPDIAARIEAANAEALERIIGSQPVLVGFAPALEVVPGMTKTTILHAGPPIEYERMAGAMKGAVTGALVFEGLAADIEEADVVARSGTITFSPCHEHDCVGSMAGVTSASMFMHIVENRPYGNRAFTNLSEQLAKILRMGANDQSVIDRLIWMRDVLGPILREAMISAKEIDLRMMLAQALHMGDEAHNRNNAGTALLIQALTPHILNSSFSTKDQQDVFNFVLSSEYFSGPTWMAASKAALDSAKGIKDSTVVVAMCRNGVDFGIRVAGTGDQWFIGPAQFVEGPLFAGFTVADKGLDIGDSAITETYGIGGFAMACAPAIVPLVGGTVSEAIEYSRSMMQITTATNPNLTIPILGFRGVATGIDVRKVEETGVLPVINTAIAHKEAGIGMIGAGLTHPPLEAFHEATLALAASF